MSSYGYGITVQGSMDTIVGKVTAALKAEGFGVLTEINVGFMDPIAVLELTDKDRKSTRLNSSH